MPWKWLNILTQHFRSGGDIAADRGFRLASILHTLKEDPASADPSAALAIVAQLHPSIDSHLHRSAIDAVERIIKSATPLDLLRLDAHARTREFYDFRYLISAEAIAVCANSTACLGLMASYPDGHVRQTVVRALAEIHTGQELPFLVIRLNDWVAPVRDDTYRAVLARIRPNYASHFARLLPLVLQLTRQSRADHRNVIDSVTSLLAASENTHELLDLIDCSDRAVSRTAFRFLCELPTYLPDPLVSRGLSSHDPAIRLRAARIASRLDDENLLRHLPHMLADRFMPVRREALTLNADRLPNRVSSILLKTLLDPHPSMRELARFLLRTRPQLRDPTISALDLAAFYRSCISSSADPHLLAIAVAGVGETGSTSDAAVAESLLQNPSPRVRASSLRAYARLQSDPPLDVFLAAITDDSASVAKLARNYLLARPNSLPRERLWSIYESARASRVRRHMLSLIAHLSWWDSLPLLLRAAARQDLDPDLKSVDYLNAWRSRPNRFSAPLNLSQLSTIESLLHSAAPHLPQAVSEDLRKSLAWTRANLAR